MPDAMGIRRQTVEHPSGTFKSWMGSTHFLTKTLQRVRTEMSLHILAYNMKRVIAIIGIGRYYRRSGQPKYPEQLADPLQPDLGGAAVFCQRILPQPRSNQAVRWRSLRGPEASGRVGVLLSLQILICFKVGGGPEEP